MNKIVGIMVFVLMTTTLCYEDYTKEGFDVNLIKHSDFLYPIIKTCSGWRLGKLPDVRDFLKYDLSYYNMDVVYCSGDPRISFVDKLGEVYHEIFITYKSREGIALLLKEYGVHRFE